MNILNEEFTESGIPVEGLERNPKVPGGNFLRPPPKKDKPKKNQIPPFPGEEDDDLRSFNDTEPDISFHPDRGYTAKKKKRFPKSVRPGLNDPKDEWDRPRESMDKTVTFEKTVDREKRERGVEADLREYSKEL